ncbi:hypothetical protein [Methanosarcina mazei]|uniref:hypothetical protein n=1 Tax=Methanosarcina mazei TaxID=2209 RepID=UPI0013D50FC8|nr:hypothetical protein [Methanosarcina mazei]
MHSTWSALSDEDPDLNPNFLNLILYRYNRDSLKGEDTRTSNRKRGNTIDESCRDLSNHET